MGAANPAFFIDGTTSTVGMGGNANLTDQCSIYNQTGSVLTSDANGVATWQAPTGGSGGWTRITETTASRTAANGEFILVNNASCVITLPAAADNTTIAIKTIIAPVDIQIKTVGGARIDGTNYSTTGLSLTSQFEQISLISDGAHWYIY